MRIKCLFLLNVNCRCENATLLLLELSNRGVIDFCQDAADNPFHNDVLENEGAN